MHKPSRLTTGIVFASSLFAAAVALSTVEPTQPAAAAVHPSAAPAAARPFGPTAVARLESGAEVRLAERQFTRHPH